MRSSYSASYKSFNCSPKKVNEVATVIRNQSVVSALGILSNHKARSAEMFMKLLLSASANAFYLDKLELESLVISEVLVGSRGSLKRRMLCARGRTGRIQKRLSFTKITLSSSNNIANKKA